MAEAPTMRVIREHHIVLHADGVRSTRPADWGEYVRVWSCLKCPIMFEGPLTFGPPTPPNLKPCTTPHTGSQNMTDTSREDFAAKALYEELRNGALENVPWSDLTEEKKNRWRQAVRRVQGATLTPFFVTMSIRTPGQPAFSQNIAWNYSFGSTDEEIEQAGRDFVTRMKLYRNGDYNPLLDLTKDIEYFESVLKACEGRPPPVTERTRETLRLLYEAKAKYAESRR